MMASGLFHLDVIGYEENDAASVLDGRTLLTLLTRITDFPFDFHVCLDTDWTEQALRGLKLMRLLPGRREGWREGGRKGGGSPGVTVCCSTINFVS